MAGVVPPEGASFRVMKESQKPHHHFAALMVPLPDKSGRYKIRGLTYTSLAMPGRGTDALSRVGGGVSYLKDLRLDALRLFDKMIMFR